MSQSECRWGFLSTAAIARKAWKAIRISGNGRVAAVASRSTDKAQRFIDECNREIAQLGQVDAIGSYEELLARPDIDAVYIPLPTGLRKSWVVAAAEAGKHVLCEKPVAVNLQDAQTMVQACVANNVQFMDGVMFDHSARLNAIRTRLQGQSAIGKLRRIQTHFSFRGDESFAQQNIRADATLEPHGALGDLGWYCIRFTLWAAGLAMPTHVTARTLTALGGQQSDQQVPGEFTAELRFGDALSAGFYCSFLTSNQQTALLSGEDGYISVDDFVLPFYEAEASWTEHRHALQIDNCRWNFGRHSDRKAVAEYPSGERNSQEVKMVAKFAQLVLDDQRDPLYPELTLKTQQILDACRRSAAANGELTEV